MTYFVFFAEAAALYCFAINNWTEEDHEAVLSLYPDKAKYLIFGKEVGKERLTPHLQGCVQLKAKLRLTAVSKLLPRSSRSS